MVFPGNSVRKGAICLIFTLILAYLLGSFPSALVVSRMLHRDARKIGSGNLGGLNVFRNIHPLAGVAVGMLDVGKGAISVYLASSISSSLWAPPMAAAFCVVGHNWQLFAGFAGGKGIASSFGAFLLIAPAVIPMFILCTLLLAFVLRDAMMAVACAYGILPLLTFVVTKGIPESVSALLMSAACIVKMLPDIRNFCEGRRRLF